MLRHLHPNDSIPLNVDPSRSGYSVPIEVQGPCTIVMLQGAGACTVQANNANLFNTRNDYGIANSPWAQHSPRPTLNTSFSSYWADTSVTGDASRGNRFMYANFNARHIRVSSASMSSATASDVYGYVFAKPRV